MNYTKESIQQQKLNNNSANGNKAKIESIQALRAISFLGIFLCHAGSSVHWSALGVSVFFVLSGFLLFYTYEDHTFYLSPKNNLKFSLNKIKKLYPLHIITMTCIVLLQLLSMLKQEITLSSIIKLFIKILLNVTLLQTWIPNNNINTSLNGVAWYLSVTMFLYFMFPWICKIIKKIRINFIPIICSFILILQLISCIPLIHYFGTNSPQYIWFMYCFPIFRLGDFFIGCCLGKLFMQHKSFNINFFITSIIEIIATIATIVVFQLLKLKTSNIFFVVLHNWTTVYIPIASMWVYLFVNKKGAITHLLSNKLLIYIGNISPYAFLIHYVVTQYTAAILKSFNININNIIYYIIILLQLVLSILLSIVYKKIHTNLITHFSKKKQVY